MVYTFSFLIFLFTTPYNAVFISSISAITFTSQAKYTNLFLIPNKDITFNVGRIFLHYIIPLV